MLRLETRGRARALQLLYAWELRGGRDLDAVVRGLSRLTGPEPRVLDRAEALAAAVIGERAALDARVEGAAENWRMSRLAVVDRNILRLGALELLRNDAPPRVVIDEGVRLAHWFGGARSPGFVNGVLDGVARGLGRL